MADPVLHIKDAYFFEVPKFLWPRDFKSRNDVYKVCNVWVELDDQYQDWEFEKQYKALQDLGVVLPPKDRALNDWHDWQHDHVNEGKPFDVFVETKTAEAKANFQAWKAKQVEAANKEPAERRNEAIRDTDRLEFLDYKKSGDHHPGDYDLFIDKSIAGGKFLEDWQKAKNDITASKYIADTHEAEWSTDKLKGYSKNSGKVLIPQPFGKLRNLHEAESGLTITKYMLVEVAVALIIAILFSWLARRVISGGAPKGRLWNFLEVFVVFIRTQIAEPAIGGGHDDHGHDDHAHGKPEPGHHEDASGHAVANASHGHGHEDHAHAPPKKGHAHAPISPAKRFTPLLCSIFFFILGCNLAGMLPWIGSPTAVFGVTLAMALVTLGTVFVCGMLQFGVFGFFANQVPTMDMPWYMAIVMKPMIFLIEFGGLLIKHGVLAVRLLANMLAGHLVLLAIMGLAFGATAASSFIQADGNVSPMWWVTATISVVGCAILSVLELFVAFLQAFVFTMLSALFIGAAVHKH